MRAFREMVKALNLERMVGHILWLKLRPVLDEIAIRHILNNPKFVYKVGSGDKIFYVTKIKDAWFVGVLARF